MTPATKAHAQEKLAKYTVKIGYPDRWRDYTALEIKPDDLIGNVVRDRQESVMVDDHIFCPRAHRRKECDTPAFLKSLRYFRVCSEPYDRPDSLKPRHP